MNKLIKFIKKLHWKIYGKKHLLNRLRKDAMRCARAWQAEGMKKDSHLDRKLTKLLDAIDTISDGERW